MERVFEGRVWKFGDDIDTDIIIPTQHLSYPSMEEIRRHAFEPLRPELASMLKSGDILVGGSNFGCGSSREQAVEVLTASGIACVVAKSFARIFFRNAINNGLLVLENSELPDLIEEGDRLKVEVNRELTWKGRTFPLAKLPDNLFQIIADGGLVKSVRKRNGII